MKANQSTITSIIILAIARLFVNTTRRFYYAFLPEISRSLNVSLLSVQNAVALQSGVGVTAPLFSHFSEQYGRKRVVLIAQSLIAFAALPGILFPDSFGIFYAAMVIWGFAKWLFDPALQAYISDRVPYKRRGLAIGTSELAWAGSLFVAAPLTGYLLGVNGLGAVYAMIFTFNVVGVLLITLFVEGDTPTRKSDEKSPVVWRVLWASPMALFALLFSVLLYVGNEILFIIYGSWMESTFDLVLAELGALTIVIALAEVVGEFTVMGISDRVGKRRLVLIGTLISSIGYVVLPWLGFSLIVFLIGLFIVFLAVEIAIVSSIPLMTEVLPHARAVMMGSNVAAQASGRFIGAWTGSLLYSAFGFEVAGAFACVIGILAFGVMLFLVYEASDNAEAD